MPLSDRDHHIARYLIEAPGQERREWLFWLRVISVVGGGLLIWWLLRDGEVAGGDLALVLFFYTIQPLALANWIYALQVERREAVRLLAELMEDRSA